MAITSVTIYRRSVNLWEIVTNENPTDPISRDAYRGGATIGGFIIINSENGTQLLPLVRWDAFEYIDEYGSNSFTPSSAQDLVQNLLDEGFFLGSSSEGGEGATAFTELTDTFPNYFGREGQVLFVEEGGGIGSMDIAPLESPTLQNVTDAGNTTNNPIVVISEDETRNISYEEDRIVYTNTGGVSRITFSEPVGDFSYDIPAKDADDTFAMLSDIAPIVTGVAKWIGKGWVGTTANILDTQEVGDIFQGSFFDIGENKWYWYPALQWLGGDLDDIDNFDWSYRDDFAFTV